MKDEQIQLFFCRKKLSGFLRNNEAVSLFPFLSNICSSVFSSGIWNSEVNELSAVVTLQNTATLSVRCLFSGGRTRAAGLGPICKSRVNNSTNNNKSSSIFFLKNRYQATLFLKQKVNSLNCNFIAKIILFYTNTTL